MKSFKSYITEEKLKNQKLNLGSAFCKSVLTLMNFRKPMEFINNMPVSLITLSKFNAGELHHIFPQGYLKKHDHENYELKDSIMNIAIASSSVNKKYKANPPSMYLKKCIKKNKNLKDSLKSHFIYEEALSFLKNDDFQKFLTSRSKTILQNILNKIGEFSPIEQILMVDERKAVEEFESQIRTLIDKKLTEVSPSYWDSISSDRKAVIESRMNDWLKKNPTKTDADISPLDFCVIFDYQKIIIEKWDVFNSFFGSKSELRKHFENINSFRNALMHSREIDKTTKKLAEASFLWFEPIFVKEIGSSYN